MNDNTASGEPVQMDGPQWEQAKADAAERARALSMNLLRPPSELAAEGKFTVTIVHGHPETEEETKRVYGLPDLAEQVIRDLRPADGGPGRAGEENAADADPAGLTGLLEDAGTGELAEDLVPEPGCRLATLARSDEQTYVFQGPGARAAAGSFAAACRERASSWWRITDSTGL
jgi:hypothetical protein